MTLALQKLAKLSFIFGSLDAVKVEGEGMVT
jgi:hypothetical protein